jgi:hypothetical protein
MRQEFITDEGGRVAYAVHHLDILGYAYEVYRQAVHV